MRLISYLIPNFDKKQRTLGSAFPCLMYSLRAYLTIKGYDDKTNMSDIS